MRIMIMGLVLLTFACTQPIPHGGSCFVQSERRDGWVQQEITCNYRPDSANHEWKVYRYAGSDTTDPFAYHPRHRRF